MWVTVIGRLLINQTKHGVVSMAFMREGEREIVQEQFE
jgi:hypothetical protein